MKPNGEIFQGGQTSGPFWLPDSGAILVIGCIPGMMEFVLDAPVFPVVAKQLMRSRPLRTAAGNPADGFLAFHTFGFPGAADQTDLRGEREVDFLCGDFGCQDPVRLDPPV